MNIVRYLPSTQFVVIVGSIALSGGLVLAAQKFTGASPTPSSLATSQTNQTTPYKDWQQTLRDIEGERPFTTTTATGDAAKALLSAAVSTNLTDSVARTLFVNLSEAKSQGLGSDIPTQDKLVAQTVAQIQKDRTLPYSEKDLVVSANTQSALKTYGNSVITVIQAHPKANYADVLYAIAGATDASGSAALGTLAGIKKEYSAVAEELARVPVPPKLRPLHLKLVNNLSLMGSAVGDMALLFSDPLRGYAGFDLYEGLSDESTRVFTNIAQQFEQDGILFNKDEPGQEWGLLLSL